VTAVTQWRESSVVPSWLPDEVDMSLDVAAALSQIPLSPEKWGRTVFRAAPAGQPWTLTITPKRYMNKDGTVRTHAYDIVVQIPGGGGKDTYGAREVLDWMKSQGYPFEVQGTT
jgi:hypothetical protein